MNAAAGSESPDMLRAQAGTLESMRGEMAATRNSVNALEALLDMEREETARSLAAARDSLIVERREAAARVRRATERGGEALRTISALQREVAGHSARELQYAQREADLMGGLNECRGWIERRLKRDAVAAGTNAIGNGGAAEAFDSSESGVAPRQEQAEEQREGRRLVANVVAAFSCEVAAAAATADSVVAVTRKPTRVFCSAVADLMHVGHSRLFRDCRRFGDFVVVGVHSDEVVKGYKRAPVNSEEERYEMVRASRHVDECIEDFPLVLTSELIHEHAIDIVVVATAGGAPIVDAYHQAAEKLGILRFLPRMEGLSTTKLIVRIQAATDLGSKQQQSP